MSVQVESIPIYENRTVADDAMSQRGFADINADKMHMLADARASNAWREGGALADVICLCETNRDVISDDEINYWKALAGSIIRGFN